MIKKLEAYGVSVHNFTSAQDAHSHTYMTNDNKVPSTPLIFKDNPYNNIVLNSKYIFEIGCGTGRNLKWIMENTSANYVAIEPNKSIGKYFWDLNDYKYHTRVQIYSNFEDLTSKLDPSIFKFDVILSTFVLQHIGYRPTSEQMNIADITKEMMKFSKPETAWILYEHDWEEDWIERWFEEFNIKPRQYIRDYTGIPELTHRKPHHLIIFNGLYE